MFLLVIKLWGKFSTKRKRQFILLLFLIIISSFSELFAIGAIIPFITALTNPDLLLNSPYFIEFSRYMEFIYVIDSKNFPLVITILFIIAVTISGGIRLLLLYVNTKLSFAAGNDISVDIYRKTLYQSYEAHLLQNSSEVVSGILIKAKRMIGSVIMPIINIVTAAFFLIFLFLFFLNLDPLIFVYGILFFGVIYAVIGFIFKKKLFHAGKIEAKEHQKVMQLLQEGLGGIRDVIIDNKQDFHVSLFSDSDYKLRKASALTTFLSSSPRFFIETILIFSISVAGYIFSKSEGGITDSLPYLGSIAIGSQRLLPILQNAFQSWANLKSISPTLEEILSFLDLPGSNRLNSKSVELSFNHSIHFSQISFAYKGAESYSLHEIDFKINKGAKIGIIGETGSGKSTLLDIIMGLLTPTSGKILIDGVELDQKTILAWQKQIAHVPQFIFLIDSSIKENIALGIPSEEIDDELVLESAKGARIFDFVESLPDKWHTKIGERGVRLSGGQRQRIGIARALYKQAEVIILDEATSALDNETESEVMNSINKLSKNLTIIIVAHRLSTIENCDELLELNNGKIKNSGNPKSIL
jgi:ATP-binding cassette, subfamily B, bacterial PglK